MLTCVILDDEQEAIDTLAAMLQKKFSSAVFVLGSTTEPGAARSLIELRKPDIVFLDIEMPEQNGLSFLESLEYKSFQVVFTTAHSSYAISALKLHASDYLLKPFGIEDLAGAIENCRVMISQGTSQIRRLLEEVHKSSALKKIAIPSGHSIHLFAVSDIIRIESSNNYSTVYFANLPKLVVSKTLKEFEDMLLLANFFRVHNSHLVNLHHVKEVKNTDAGYVIMRDNTIIEISRRRKHDFLERLHLL